MNKFLLVLVPLLLAMLPAFGAVSVTNGLVRNHIVHPGETFEGVVLIRNSGTRFETVRLYQTDYRFEAAGRRYYGAPGTLERSNAAWFSLTPVEVMVAPGATETVVYRGRVPGDSDLSGSYWSMVMVERLGRPPPATEDGDDRISVGISTVMRFGVQVATHIGDSGTRDLRILEVNLANENGDVFLVLDVENTGERMLRPTVEADLFSAEGATALTVESGPKRIYPGSSVRHRLNVSGLSAGRYRALVVLDNGDDHVFGARYNLEIRP